MLIQILITSALVGAVNLTDLSFYEILGVSKESSGQEIRQAYKKLAIKLHPDKNPDAKNQEKFLKITEAYETLKDPDKKRKYDLYGSYQTYSRKYDHKSQAEYDNLYYNGLYHDDPFVETLGGNSFFNYLKDGLYFINFYSPFCPPCQSVSDHWKKLAELYEGVVKVGAVNCKYYNSFCYNSMRIGSYPSLLFYPNGKNGNYIYYRGERTLDALDDFVMQYVKSRVHVPTVTQIKTTHKPFAYVLGANRIDRNALTRIAYQLNGLVTVVIVADDSLRGKLTSSDNAAVVFKYRDVTKDIDVTGEKELLKELVSHLPQVEPIDPETFQSIRNKLRSGSKTPWVIYFYSDGSDRLQFHRMMTSMPDMHFGEINCEKWAGLCASLQGGAGAGAGGEWGVLKPGGGYQRAAASLLPLAAQAANLHTMSATEFSAALNADSGVWALLVIPYRVSWNDMIEPFTRASIRFLDSNINFGIMSCDAQTEHHCRRVAHAEPALLLQNGTARIYYSGQADEHQLAEFIHLIKDSSDMEISEEQVLEILDVSSRSHCWVVAHLPARCGAACHQLAHQWRKVYTRLRPLEFVRVGILMCKSDTSGFCQNIRVPTARLYPIASGHHYSVNLQQLNDAPYILEWALERIDDSVQKLNWNSFTKTVIAEELNPISDAKPWLVYFHSPRCYRCYEMYPEFAITGILLNNAVQTGKVNCVTERGLCQHEHITSYPALKLYLGRNHRQTVSSVVTVQIREHDVMIQDIRIHLELYTGSRLGVGAKHDEF